MTNSLLLPAIIGSIVASAGLVIVLSNAPRRKKGKPSTNEKGQCHGLKATSICVPLTDGSACVVHRRIAGDNSCLFNSIGYCVSQRRDMAYTLRSIVAKEIVQESNTWLPPGETAESFLGMSTIAYQHYIQDRNTWGGGLELRILSMIYKREIITFNIETARQHTFGEEMGFTKAIMVIYNGVHYDALAIAKSPRGKEPEDLTEFNPRTKRGKMIVAAAQKMVELKNKGAQFTSNTSGSTKLRCDDCKKTFASEKDAKAHAEKTSHTSFSQVK